MSVSQKQTVEIVKVLYRGADILILDEPTAVLTPQETDKLFAIMRNMKRRRQVPHHHHAQAARGARRDPTAWPCCARANTSATVKTTKDANAIADRHDGRPHGEPEHRPPRAEGREAAPRGQGLTAASTSWRQSCWRCQLHRSTPARCSASRASRAAASASCSNPLRASIPCLRAMATFYTTARRRQGKGQPAVKTR